jgi:hypothetical protein
MRHLRLFENFDQSDYAELSWKMDKYMPEDSEVMDEYYELLQGGNEKELEDFFFTHADEDRMNDYMPKGGDMKGFMKYLIDNETVDEKADPSVMTWKDRGRIEDLVNKANGNQEKVIQLGKRMAKSIKDGFKALRRGLAAEDGNWHELAKIFFDRADELNSPADEVLPVTKVEDAPKEVEKEVAKEAAPDEIAVGTIPYKEKPGHKKIFWKEVAKDRYNGWWKMTDEQKEILENVLGGNEALWAIARKGLDVDTIKQDDLESEFENKTPGYIGRFSGDLKVEYKGSVSMGEPLKTYYKTYTKYLDTRGFW